MNKAIVVGYTGQDGYYLSKLLHEKNYEVIGISSAGIAPNPYGITQVDVIKAQEVEALLDSVKPDEIYFLAAVHQSSSDAPIEEGVLFQKSLDLNVKALVNFLEGARKYSSHSKVFYAASSHIFGNPQVSPQDEETPMQPDCIYGITKTAGIHACRFYRENHNIFASVGIFYNHESPARASKYVSKKIIEGAIAIRNKVKNELVLGNLDSEIDWGYARDYMEAVYGLMQLSKSDEFVISSGEKHTIKDFLEGVFKYLELDWSKYVKLNAELITKKQKQNLFGNNQKITKAIGWKQHTNFEGLIKMMVDEELKRNGSK